MTRAERTEYMRQWRRNNPEKSREAVRRASRKKYAKHHGWAIGTTTIFGIRCRTELYRS